MKFSFALVFQFLLFTICVNAPEQLTVRGRLLTHDGQPLRNAYVSLQGQNSRFRHKTDSSGQFSFAIGKEGGYWLWLAGLHHKTLLIPLLVDEPLQIEVRLSAADYVFAFDSVFVIGDFNDFSDEEGAVLMNRRSDGTFVAVIETNSDTLGYQLLGVQKENHPIGGTQADRYVFDSKRPLLGNKSGKYISVVNVTGGKAQIVFDPNDMPRSAAEEIITFEDSAGVPARIVAVRKEIEKRKQPFFEAFQAHRKAGKDPNEFQYDWSDDRAALAQRIDREKNELVRQYLLLNYFHFGNSEEDSLMARTALEELPPASMLWSLQWAVPANTFYTIARIAKQPDVAKTYVQEVIEEHPDPTVRAPFLLYALGQARYAGEADLAGRYYTRLMAEFGDTDSARMAKARYAPNRNIMKGKPVPDFTFMALDDSTKTYTREALRGKIYLIDFWAVWCAPCVSEMENLHKAYEKYKGKGFTILSLSFDRRPQNVIEFRKKKWPMPWLNAFVEGGFRSGAAKTFEVAGIPKPVLVGEDGKIIATEAGLRGEKLEETLGSVFGVRQKAENRR